MKKYKTMRETLRELLNLPEYRKLKKKVYKYSHAKRLAEQSGESTDK